MRLFSQNAGGQENRTGTGPPDVHAPMKGSQQSLFHSEDPHQPGKAGALPTWEDQPRNIFKITGFFDSFSGYSQTLQMVQMLANPSLKIKNTDSVL